jgi:hypothetical protein
MFLPSKLACVRVLHGGGVLVKKTKKKQKNQKPFVFGLQGIYNVQRNAA